MWIGVGWCVAATLASAWYQDLTTDEPDHLAYSRRLLLEGETERASHLHFNSKTPIIVPNVLARRAARRQPILRQPTRLRFAARLPTLAWLLVLLGSVWWVGRSLGGTGVAQASVLLVAMDPNFVAHASIVTVDVVFAMAAFLALAAAWGVGARPSPVRSLLFGVALGTALVAKLMAPLLLPLAALGVLLGRRSRSPNRPRLSHLAAAAAFAGVLALALLCAAYRNVGVGQPLGSGGWRYPPMQALVDRWPELRLPVPIDYLTGIDISLSSERRKNHPVLVAGETRGPTWYFYLLHWALKTPLAVALLLLVGLAALWRRRPPPAVVFFLLCFAFGSAYLSFAFRAQIGYRHFLWCLPFAAVAAAWGLGPSWRPSLAWALVALAALEQLPYLGNHLAFTNTLVLPKASVYRWIADVDFGQNDDRAARRAAAEGWHLNPFHPLPGRMLVSVPLLYHPEYRWARDHLEPQEHFRFSHVIFDVDASTFRSFLRSERHFPEDPEDRTLCGEPAAPLASKQLRLVFPAPTGTVTLLCLELTAESTLALAGETGFAAIGRTTQPRRSWLWLGPADRAWFSLAAGRHAIAMIAQRGEFTGSIETTAALRAWQLPVPLIEGRVRPAP